jgi:hypothetical protein
MVESPTLLSILGKHLACRFGKFNSLVQPGAKTNSTLNKYIAAVANLRQRPED